MTRSVRNARAAVGALFFVNAVLYANLVPRLPEIKERLELSNAALGAGIAAMPVGALLAGLAAPWFIGSVRLGAHSHSGCSSSAPWTRSSTSPRTRTGSASSGGTVARS